MAERGAVVSVEGLSKAFSTPGGTLEVLRQVDFVPPAGQVTAIVGASGAGKSTLLHLLGALDRPSSGRILPRQMLLLATAPRCREPQALSSQRTRPTEAAARRSGQVAVTILLPAGHQPQAV